MSGPPEPPPDGATGGATERRGAGVRAAAERMAGTAAHRLGLVVDLRRMAAQAGRAIVGRVRLVRAVAVVAGAMLRDPVQSGALLGRVARGAGRRRGLTGGAVRAVAGRALDALAVALARLVGVAALAGLVGAARAAVWLVAARA